MAHQPGQRFKNVRQMAQAIQDWLDGVQQEEQARQLLTDVATCKAEVEQNLTEIQVHRHTWEDVMGALHDDEEVQQSSAWSAWAEIERLEQINREQRLKIRRLCHSAQMAAPQVLGTYQELLELEYQDLMDVLSTGNYHLIQKVQDRLEMMMAPLSSTEQSHWLKRIELDRRSRTNRVHVERIKLIQTVHEALQQHRWVTIVGLAGVGKTHLAWQLARRWHQDHDGVVYFLDVSGVVTAAELTQAVYALLDMQQVDEDPQNSIVEALYRLDGVMFIVDNAEQLDFESVQLLKDIQERVHNGHFLLTSRRSLLNSELSELVPIQPFRLIEGVSRSLSIVYSIYPMAFGRRARYWLVYRSSTGQSLPLDRAAVDE